MSDLGQPWWPCVRSLSRTGPGRGAEPAGAGWDPTPASSSCPPSILQLLGLHQGTVPTALDTPPCPPCTAQDRTPWGRALVDGLSPGWAGAAASPCPVSPQAWRGPRGRQGDHAAPLLCQHRVAGCVREEGVWGRCLSTHSHPHTHVLTHTHRCTLPSTPALTSTRPHPGAQGLCTACSSLPNSVQGVACMWAPVSHIPSGLGTRSPS